MTADFTTDLLTGLAEYLAEQGIGAWSPAAAYAATDVGILLGDPQQQPAQQISIRAYNQSDHVRLDDVTVRVQLRFRGADATAAGPDGLADAVHDVLHGLMRTTLPNGAFLVGAQRINTTPLDPDTTGRYQRADNYELRAHNYSALLDS